MRLTMLLVVLALALAAPRGVRADEPTGSDAVTPSVSASVEAGAFVPVAFAPRVGDSAGTASLASGYQSAGDGMVLRADAEARVLRWLAVRGGVEVSTRPERQRPFVGVRVQVLDQSEDGVDGSLGLAYQQDGFRSAEGRLELAASLSRRIDALGLYASLAYAQDEENDDRQADLQLAALHRFSRRFHAGAGARVRADLFSDDVKRQPGESDLELVAGPLASVAVGAFAIFGQVGVSAVHVEHFDVGVHALGGIGAAF